MLVDTHCHLHLLESPPEQVVAEAAAEGVGHLVDVGVDLPSSRQAAANAARLEQVSATAGVHPHDADGFDGAALEELRRLLGDERVPRRAKLALALLVPYLVMPIDLIPDVIPVLGQLDDALLVLAAVAYVVRVAGPDVVRELWPGSEDGLRAVLRASRSN